MEDHSEEIRRKFLQSVVKVKVQYQRNVSGRAVIIEDPKLLPIDQNGGQGCLNPKQSPVNERGRNECPINQIRVTQKRKQMAEDGDETSGNTSQTPEIDLRTNALISCAEWNAKTNRERGTFSVDFQTGTIHFPQKAVKMGLQKIGKYPVAVLPGQFTDGYKSYTRDEWKYMPLNTVLYGPVLENCKANSADESLESDGGGELRH